MSKDSDAIESERDIYYLGIIDILQEYSFQKQFERFWKVKILRRDKVE